MREVIGLMRDNGISQMPVLEARRLAAGRASSPRSICSNYLVQGEGGLDTPIDALVESRLRDGHAGDPDPPAAQHLQRRARWWSSRSATRSSASSRKIDLIEYLAERRDERREAPADARRAARVRDPRDPRRPAARPGDRRRDDAGVLDLDLRAEGAGRAHRASSTRAPRTRPASRSRPTWRRSRGATGGWLRAGVAASTAVLPLLDAGDHVVAGRRPLRRHVPAVRQGVPPAGHDVHATSTRATPARSSAAIEPSTQLCWVETPTNPMLKLADIAPSPQVCAAPRRPALRRQHVHDAVLPAAARARRRPGRALDDEVPQRPLRRGRRRGRSATDPSCATRLAFLQNAIGGSQPPMDSFLVLRGTKTLPVRMERHEENARADRALAGGAPRGRAGHLSRACARTRSTRWRAGRCPASAA